MGTSIYFGILKYHLGKDFNIITFLLGSRDQECYTDMMYGKFSKYNIFFDILSPIQKKIIDSAKACAKANAPNLFLTKLRKDYYYNVIKLFNLIFK